MQLTALLITLVCSVQLFVIMCNFNSHLNVNECFLLNSNCTFHRNKLQFSTSVFCTAHTILIIRRSLVNESLLCRVPLTKAGFTKNATTSSFYAQMLTFCRGVLKKWSDKHSSLRSYLLTMVQTLWFREPPSRLSTCSGELAVSNCELGTDVGHASLWRR